MLKRISVISLAAILLMVFVVLASDIKYDFKKCDISVVETRNSDYIQRNLILSNKTKTIRPEINWKLNYSSNTYLEAKIVGEKENEETGSYSISTLSLVKNNKTTVIEKDCYSFGRISWSPDGNQFIYLKVTTPPVDYSMGDVYLVTLENGNVKEKKLIVEHISSSDFRWGEKNNIVAFADFETIYIVDTINKKSHTLTGMWAKDIKKYEKGTGYPRMCGSFVWLNNDRELFFTYYPDVNIKENNKIYKIKFK